MSQLKAWFDTEAYQKPSDKKTYDVLRMLPFVFLHLGCLGVIWVGVSRFALLLALLLYVLRMFAITGFYHRYFSHKAFKTNRFWQGFFAVIAASSCQRGPLWWASHHRYHHRHADKTLDFHSPVQHGFLKSHMGWFFAPNVFKTDLTLVRDLAVYPELRWLNRFDTVVPIIMGIGLYVLGSYLQYKHPHWGTSGLQCLVWGGFISTVVLFHATCSINSLAHTFGSRTFQTNDNSRNHFLLAIITMGEGWHNNHHHQPGSVKQGFLWWQIDLTYYLLWLLACVGMIHSLRGVRVHEHGEA